MNRITALLFSFLFLCQNVLAEDAAPTGLTGLGWVFMLVSITGVWALAIFCYKKLLFDDE